MMNDLTGVDRRRHDHISAFWWEIVPRPFFSESRLSRSIHVVHIGSLPLLY